MPRRSLIVLLATIAFSFACYWRADRSLYARYVAEALELIDQNYVEPVDGQKLFDGAMEGMVGRLDKYSGFISHDDATRFHQSLDQRFGGIGIEVALDAKTEKLMVTTPVANTPAYREGVRAGDQIVAIDGQTLESIPVKERLNSAVNLLRGKEGEPVTLTILHSGEQQPVEMHLVRAIIAVDSVLGDTRFPDNRWNFMLAQHPGIGYIRVTSFGEQTLQEFTEAMQQLAEANCKGVIIDMRNNPGGLLNAARDICDLFLTAGEVIVTTRDREGHIRDKYTGSGRGPYPNLPLVVLVDRGSASASEILASCLQDHGRAKVVGQRTWGKGTVQHVIPIEGGRSVLRLTTASYWRPNDKNIHRFEKSKETDSWGVMPDPGCEAGMSDKQLSAWVEQRRKRDVVHPVGTTTVEPASDATEFDPVLNRAVELFETPAAREPQRG